MAFLTPVHTPPTSPTKATHASEHKTTPPKSSPSRRMYELGNVTKTPDGKLTATVMRVLELPGSDDEGDNTPKALGYAITPLKQTSTGIEGVITRRFQLPQMYESSPSASSSAAAAAAGFATTSPAAFASPTSQGKSHSKRVGSSPEKNSSPEKRFRGSGSPSTTPPSSAATTPPSSAAAATTSPAACGSASTQMLPPSAKKFCPPTPLSGGRKVFHRTPVSATPNPFVQAAQKASEGKYKGLALIRPPIGRGTFFTVYQVEGQDKCVKVFLEARLVKNPEPLANFIKNGLAYRAEAEAAGVAVVHVHNSATAPAEGAYVVEFVPNGFTPGMNLTAKQQGTLGDMLIKLSRLNRSPDFVPSNCRIRQDGTIVLIDFPEEDDESGFDEMTSSLVRSIRKWAEIDSSLTDVMLTKLSKERPDLYPAVLVEVSQTSTAAAELPSDLQALLPDLSAM
jgi:hypothetical protein